jgi:hypothetical protein
LQYQGQRSCYLTTELVSLSSAWGAKRRRALNVPSEAAQTRFSGLVALMEIANLVIEGLPSLKAGALWLMQSSHFADCRPA